MKIFTVRHGQTEWNAQRRMQGHTDIGLDETGREQARKIGARLADEQVEIIYTSDLSRAADTAAAINAHHDVEIIATPALRESSFGIYEGRVYDEVFEEINWDFPDGGESADEKFARIHKCLDEILAGRHENVVIVGHHGTVKAVICYFLGLAPSERHRFAIGNTAIHCFEKDADGKWAMTLENDTDHL